MAGDVSIHVEVDRSTSVFNITLDYYIPGYSDPETDEYFGDTSWTYTFTDVDTGQSGGTGGYASEGDSIWLEIGLGPDTELRSYTVSFNAQNTFSAVSAALDLSIFSAANSTGHQHIHGTAGVDVILGGEAGDELSSMEGNDWIDAGGGADAIAGGTGQDTLDGGAGADTMVGNEDDDLYRIDRAGDVIVEQAGEGNDSVIATASYTLPAELERLALTGYAPIDGVGNAIANRIDGNDAANTLRGRAGNDDLRGGAGVDQLYGERGNDTLEGGPGGDSLYGGAGSDTYRIGSHEDRLVELADAGIDTVLGLGLTRYRLPANVEAFHTLPTVFPDFAPAIQLSGNELNNGLYAGSGDDTLDGGAGSDWIEGAGGKDLFLGGAGNDALRGGDGVDTVSYRASSVAVTVRLDQSAGFFGDAAGDEIRGVENVLGSAFGDLLVGYAVDNVLNGGAGDDELRGSFGNDTLIGGSGADVLSGDLDVDTLSYAGSTAGALQIDLAAGTVAGGDGEGDTIAGFESVIAGTGDDSITGAALANALVGGAGNDTISGAAGNDTLTGGTGGDTLDGGEGADTVSYAGSASGVSVALDEPNPGDQHAVGGDATDDALTGFEHVLGGKGDDTLVGGIIGNRLAGGAGADQIEGNAGNDTIAGGAGADTLIGGDGIDTLSYAGSSGSVTVYLQSQSGIAGDAAGDVLSGFENMEGGSGHDYLIGNADANRISAGAGYDAIEGAAGNDTLRGGGDSDTFVFQDGFGDDTVVDFDGDVIQIALGAGFDTLAEVMAVATEIVDGVVFQLGSAGSITVLNATLADFSAENLLFG